MCALHQEIVIADNGLSACMCGTVDDHILADDVIIADDEFAALAFEFKVLRQCSDD